MRIMYWSSDVCSSDLPGSFLGQSGMSVRPYRDILRRKSRQIHVGKVPVGGDAPITVQTMTNTRTTDIQGTIDQVRAMALAGADIVRIACPAEDSTREVGRASCREGGWQYVWMSV